MREAPRPRPATMTCLVGLLAFLVLYLPLITIVVSSFLVPVSSTYSDADLGMVFGLAWYHKVLANPQILTALWTSLVVAASSTVIATLLGTLTALALQRGHFPASKWLDAVVLMPLVMPELVLGLSLLLWFVLLRLVLGWTSIILAHVTFCFSYVVIIVRGRLRTFDQALAEAAFDLGASRWQSFWYVKFPLIRPGVIAGALMAFTLSFDDFIIAFFTAGVGTNTLPLRLYSMMRLGISREIYALSTLLLVGTFAAILLLSWYGEQGWLTRNASRTTTPEAEPTAPSR